jgi:hypothetical protein
MGCGFSEWRSRGICTVGGCMSRVEYLVGEYGRAIDLVDLGFVYT